MPRSTQGLYEVPVDRLLAHLLFSSEAIQRGAVTANSDHGFAYEYGRFLKEHTLMQNI